MRAQFDVICKDLICDLAATLEYTSEAPFPIDPQEEVKLITGYGRGQRSSYSTVDAAWLRTIAHTQGKAKELFPTTFMSDVVVAWEVDAVSGHKAIRTSIDNLATLNPRLGIELLLIGGNKKAIESFESRFGTALLAARLKPSRIIVIHDVIFCNLYWEVTGEHPLALYNEYLRIGQEPSFATMLARKWIALCNQTNTDEFFRKGLHEELLDKLATPD